MKTGIIEIVFKEGISDDKIMKVIADVYNQNKLEIDGMEFKQFKDKQTLLDVRKKIDDALDTKDEKEKKE